MLLGMLRILNLHNNKINWKTNTKIFTHKPYLRKMSTMVNNVPCISLYEGPYFISIRAMFFSGWLNLMVKISLHI